jgi:K+-transporting ATPase ATPase C chain
MNQFSPAIRLMVLCSILTGFLYPCLITGIAQLMFPWEANGSFLNHHGIRVGSYLIGQSFTASYYFWGRPSDTPTVPYNALSSAGANLGPSDLGRLQGIQTRITTLRTVNNDINTTIPFNLVAASGSGLDPDISASAARYQIFRVAKARGLPIETVAHLVEDAIISRTLSILGEPRVNVLQLNLVLDRISPPTLANIRNYNGKTP